jgi:hypothetical protein
MRLQTSRQGRNESTQEFADRCRALSQKSLQGGCPLGATLYYENADRMLRATFVAGLTGVPSRQVRFSNPQTSEQVLKIALFDHVAEKQEFSESFYASFDNSLRQHYPSLSRHASHRPHGVNLIYFNLVFNF